MTTPKTDLTDFMGTNPTPLLLNSRQAAEYLRTDELVLCRWRTIWREAERKGNLALRRGPKFITYPNGHVRYALSDLDEYKTRTAIPAHGLLPSMAAKLIDSHPLELAVWRRTWLTAEKLGKAELRNGPKFYGEGERVWYEKHDLYEFLARTHARS